MTELNLRVDATHRPASWSAEGEGRSPARSARAGRLLAALLILTGFGPSASGDDAPTYEQDIKPLFSRRCTVCHNEKKLGNPDVSGGLALDRFDAVLAGTKDCLLYTSPSPRD